jgi:transcriptional regulator with XRE-family HTH domain
MANLELRNKAIGLRKEGMSYSQIKDKIGVSKSTLSDWLKDMPLSNERINELRGWSEQRIERCRNTKRLKHEARLNNVYNSAADLIGELSDREIYMGGLFLYWAEGTKASPGKVEIANTDPKMLLFFIRWFEQQRIDTSRIRVKLHLYTDMDIEEETSFWEETLELPRAQFRKPYLKETFYSKRKNYKGRFGHGTCVLSLTDVTLYEKVMMGIRYLGDSYLESGFPNKPAV